MKRNYRYIIVTVALIFSCSSTIAQGIKDGYYLQIHSDLNKSANEHLPWTEFSAYPLSFGGSINLGKEMTPTWGWRSSIGLNHNKSRNVEQCENKNTWGWNDVEFFSDATFDIIDAFKLRREANLNIKAFAGVGLLWTFGFSKDEPLSYTAPYSKNSKLVGGVRAGIMTNWKLSDNIRIGFELSQTLAQDAFNGVNDNRLIDGRTNLGISLTWLLQAKKVKKKQTPIIYANRLKIVPKLPLIIPQKELDKHRKLDGRAFLDFPVNEIIIYSDYRNNPQELNKIKQSIEQARFDNSVQITDINLHGYASPESPYHNNERLAKGRTIALVNYLKSEFKLTNVTFHTEYTPEDWDNLRSYIADSIIDNTNCVFVYKQELLHIIDSDLELDEKEDALKSVGNGVPYKWLYKHVYPALRHTDYSIDYRVRDYPIKEARRLIYTHPEALSLDEMYRVATSYEEDTEGYFDAMIIAARNNPSNQIANLNAACTCVKRRKLRDAREFLKRANKRPETKYVLQVIQAMEGTVKWHLESNKLVIDD